MLVCIIITCYNFWGGEGRGGEGVFSKRKTLCFLGLHVKIMDYFQVVQLSPLLFSGIVHKCSLHALN